MEVGGVELSRVDIQARGRAELAALQLHVRVGNHRT